MTKTEIRLTGTILAVLGIIGMLGPFGTDIYLPALPAMERDLRVSNTHIELTLSMFTLGMAVGQFFLGALSDRVGRKFVVVGGGVLMAVTSFLAGLAVDATMLIVLCLFMGMSAAAGLVAGRAIVADLTHGEKAVRPFTFLVAFVNIGPVLGPLGGTALLLLGGWRLIFFGMAIYAAVSAVLALIFVPETLAPEDRHTGGLGAMVHMVVRVLKDKQYRAYAMMMWFGFGMMFAYIASSSFVIQHNLGLNSAAYSLSFAVNGVGIITAGLVSTQLAKRFHARSILRIGVIFQIVALSGLWIVLGTGSVAPQFVLPLMFLIPTSMGFVFGPATAMAIEKVRFASGTAMALMGSLQFVAAAIAAVFVGLVSSDALVAMTVVGTVAVALVVGAFIMTRYVSAR